MLKMENIPYRQWGTGRYKGMLVECAEGKRVMSLMYKEMARGKSIDFRQNPPETATPPVGSARILTGVYDTISLTITD